MNISELKTKVEEYRKSLVERNGRTVVFSETGPVGMKVIDALVQALETQAMRIDELERNVPMGLTPEQRAKGIGDTSTGSAG